MDIAPSHRCLVAVCKRAPSFGGNNCPRYVLKNGGVLRMVYFYAPSARVKTGHIEHTRNKPQWRSEAFNLRICNKSFADLSERSPVRASKVFSSPPPSPSKSNWVFVVFLYVRGGINTPFFERRFPRRA